VLTGFEESDVLSTADSPTSLDVSVTAPVRPETLVTAADTVPDDTDSPDPTMSPPNVVVVAAGNVYDDPPETVTAPVWPLTLVTGAAAATAVEKSVIWLAVCVCEELALPASADDKAETARASVK
jgi:hypothetical protein